MRTEHLERWGKAAGVVTMVAVLALTAAGYRNDDQRRAHVAAESARINALPRPAVTVDQPKVALFVGDAYAGGGGVVGPSAAFPCVTAALLSWECRIDALAGTGYTQSIIVDGVKRPTYAGRLLTDKQRWRPDVIVVTSGATTEKGTQVEKAAAGYFRDAHKTFPAAKLVAVLPLWTDDDPPAAIQRTRDAVRRAARDSDAAVIDPNGWLWDDLLTGEQQYPSAYGHQMIAKKLAQRLADAVGVKMPPLPLGWPKPPEDSAAG